MKFTSCVVEILIHYHWKENIISYKNLRWLSDGYYDISLHFHTGLSIPYSPWWKPLQVHLPWPPGRLHIGGVCSSPGSVGGTGEIGTVPVTFLLSVRVQVFPVFP